MFRWLQPVLTAASAVWRGIRTIPHLSPIATLLAVGVVMVMQSRGFHMAYDDSPKNGADLLERIGWVRPTVPMLWLRYFLPYLGIWMLAGGVVFHIAILRAAPDLKRALRPVWVAAFFLALWAVASDIGDHLEHVELSISGEPTSMLIYVVKLVMIVVACLVPAVGVTYYSRAMLLDRYTLRTFLQPLLFCFVAFSSLWVLMDLLDSLKDFQDAKISLPRMLLFYLKLLPFIFVSISPAAVLLGVLYTLTKMSRANEIVSMLTAGRSVLQVLKPIFVVSLLCSILALAANYHWGPRAEGNRQALMRALADGEDGTVMAEQLMFRNEEMGRTWYAGKFPFNLRDEKLRDVEVRQENAEGELEQAWIARSATWWPGSGVWRFYQGLEIRYVDGRMNEVIDFTGDDGGPFRLDVMGMGETPWSIVSSALTPDFMGVPDLVSYLSAHAGREEEKLHPFRAHLHHRFSFPWQSFTLALVAAPLGLSFSRRGMLGGVAGSIAIFFGMMFVNDLFLGLGKGGHLAAWLTVWIPVLGFGIMGVALLHYRSQNKELPNLNPFAVFKKKAVVLRPSNRNQAPSTSAA